MNNANDHYRQGESAGALREAARAAIQEFNRTEYEALGNSEHVPRLLHEMEGTNVIPATLVRIVALRYQVADRFVTLLKRAIDMRKKAGGSDDDLLLQALKNNLSDEIGGYGGEPPHEVGRRDALAAFGIDCAAWEKEVREQPAKSTTHFLTQFEALMAESSLAAGSALLYYEGRIHREGRGDYHRLLRGLETAFPDLKKAHYQPGDALYHIASHACHDEGHEHALIEGVSTAVSSEAELETVERVLSHAQNLWNAYWELLREEILP